MRALRWPACIALVGLTCVSVAEEPGADELFQQARSLAFAGERDEARKLCHRILERSPGYMDVSILLGRLHAWDKDYDGAREILSEVVAARPDYADARNALIDVELWSKHFEQALRLAEEGLDIEAQNLDHRFRKARALDKLGRGDEAIDLLLTVLAQDPGRRDAKRLLYPLLDKSQPSKVGLDVGVETFRQDLDNWEGVSVDYRRRFDFGSVLGRVNYAHRFGDDGYQFEIDAYPRLRRKTYLFLNLGYSSTDLFPQWRSSAEVYHNFPDGWEASLGFRNLKFSSSDVTIFTATGARYFGNYWLSFRPNFVHKSDDDSLSGRLTLRRFLRGRYEYVEFSVGGGTDEDLNVITQEQDSLDDFSARAEIRRRVSRDVILKGAIGYRSEELSSGNRDSLFFRFGVDKHF